MLSNLWPLPRFFNSAEFISHLLKLAMKTFLILCLAMTSLAFADNYEINVTREEQDLYRITGEDILISTQFCYEFVYYADAYLRMNGQVGDITFLDSSSSCNVRGAYGDLGLEEGAYSVTVSRESSNWYEIREVDGYIQTRLCLELALADDATLQVSSLGGGTLYFSDGEECDVQKVYGALDL